jgi:peptidyl-prolyl cis-trans isomerase C
MSGRARAALAFAVSLAVMGGMAALRADEDPRSKLVVAKVGANEISAQSLEQRMKMIPDFQLATLGASPDEAKRQVLEQVLVREALFAEAARVRKLERTSPTKERIDDALRVARINLLKTGLSVGPEEIAAFYVANQGRFDTPERIGVYRILCGLREEAASVIAGAKQSGTLLRWNELARERSIDKATSFRSGNLGFIASDGSSSEASVRVDPALFAAASRVKDGEIVPEPVKEGEFFAAVWRRGSTPAVHRTIEEETNAIRQVLSRKKLEEGARALLKQLRSERKVEQHPELVDLVEVDSNGSLVPRKRPGVLPRKPATPPAPSATPRGLR